jgi:hypothetical protein
MQISINMNDGPKTVMACLLCPALLFRQRHNAFQNKHYPRRSMQDKVEPVDRPHELPLHQHLELFPDMRRRKRGEPQGQAGEDDEPPWQFRDIFHHFNLDKLELNWNREEAKNAKKTSCS